MEIPTHYDKMDTIIGHFTRIKKRVKINGVENLNYSELLEKVNNGERFYIFKYRFFLFFSDVRGYSSIYFGKNKFSTVFARIMCSVFSLTLFILMMIGFLFYNQAFVSLTKFNTSITVTVCAILFCTAVSLPSVVTNLKGGIDITGAMMRYIKEKNTKSMADEVS